MGLLSPPEVQALHAALSDTYSTRDSLRTLVQQAAGLSVDQVSGPGPLPAVITDVIEHAESGNWLQRLIELSVQQRPGNQALNRLSRQITVRSAMEPTPFEASRVNGGPLADRKELRTALRRLEQGTSARVLVVDGDPVSGKSYTLSLISHVAQRRRFPLAAVKLDRMARFGPVTAPAVGASIASQLGLQGMPEPSEEQESRWVGDFLDWLAGALLSDATPRWVVLDGFTNVAVSQGTELLISELSDRAYVNITSLRLVLLAYTKRADLEYAVPGRIEHERIESIPRPELEQGLLAFFLQEYLERASLEGLDVEPQDVMEPVTASVHWVLEQVRDDDPVRLLKLGRAVKAELARASTARDPVTGAA